MTGLGGGFGYVDRNACREQNKCSYMEYIWDMRNFRKKSPSWKDAQPELRDWYQSPLGEAMLDTVSTHFDQILPGIFGYQGVQVGQIAPQRELLSSAGLHRRIVVDSFADDSGAHISGELEQLPISNNCVNLVFYPHSLEFCESPHVALREADRVLTADGHLLLMGFNPYSHFSVFVCSAPKTFFCARR